MLKEELRQDIKAERVLEGIKSITAKKGANTFTRSCITSLPLTLLTSGCEDD